LEVSVPRPSKTGIRGLYKNTATGRYHFDLRYRDPRTGAFLRHKENFGTGIQAMQAKERARALANALLSGTYEAARTPTRRLREAFDEYLKWADANRAASADDRRAHSNALVTSIGDMALDAITPFQVERFKTERANAGRAPGTINRHLATFKHFIGLASDWDWIPREKAAALRRVKLAKEPPGRVRYLSLDEEKKLLTTAEPDLRTVIFLACLTGMRRAEMVSLRWSQVDLHARVIVLTKTKANRVRRIPINDALHAMLEPLRACSTAEGHVLVRRGKPWSPHMLSILFAATTKTAGIANLHLHDLRHDFATRLVRAGKPINVVATLLGHSTLTTTQRYAHVEDSTLRAAVAAITSPMPEQADHAAE
jgi:integrase